MRTTTTKAVITETEAYAGEVDKASHAYAGRRTARTEPMYQQGGIAYVYLCYGIHHLFNVVSGPQGLPHATLIRACRPLVGERTMRRRRGKARKLMAGPGTSSQALGIRVSMTGCGLQGPRIWLEDHSIEVPESAVSAGPRIGVDYAGEDASLPYRFVWHS